MKTIPRKEDSLLYHSPLIKMLEAKEVDKESFFVGKEAYSIEDIISTAKKVALHLQENGFQSGERAVLLAAPDFDFIVALYAIILLKGVAAIIDPDMGSSLYLNRLKQFSPTWIFIDYRLALLQRLGGLRFLYEKFSKHPISIPYLKGINYVVMGTKMSITPSLLTMKELKKPAFSTVLWETAHKKLDFLVTYTSGTLAVPKGVIHSDEGLMNSLSLLAKKIRAFKGHNMVSHLPHFALIGIMADVKVFLWKKEWNPAKRIKFINQHNIHIFFGPPVEINELLEYCKKHNLPFPKSLKYILLGSAPIYKPFLQKLRKFTDAKVECLYGMTENLLVCAIDAEEKIQYKGKGDIVGSPFPDVIVKTNQDDEILINSPQLFEGYLEQPRRAQGMFHPTGDLGFLDAKGRVILTGRKKNMIIRKEYNLYPGLYEPTINQIPGIDKAVMIGKYNPSLADEEVYLIVQRSGKISRDKILSLLRSGPYKIDTSALPDHIIFAKIPRKGRQQKVDYTALRKLLEVEEL